MWWRCLAPRHMVKRKETFTGMGFRGWRVCCGRSGEKYNMICIPNLCASLSIVMRAGVTALCVVGKCYRSECRAALE